MSTAIVFGILLLAIGAVVYRMVKNRGKGCSGCSGCGAENECPSKQKL